MARAPYIDPQKVTRQKITRVIISVIAVIILAYICARGTYEMQVRKESAFFLTLFNSFDVALENWNRLSFSGEFWEWFLLSSILCLFAVWVRYDQHYNDRHYKDGEQYGTASFQTTSSIKAFNRKFNLPLGKDYPDSPFNTILTKHCQLGADDRDVHRNSNLIVIGSPGTGKSHYVVKPNILQAGGIDPTGKHKAASLVITDPSGELLAQTGTFLQNAGYEIRVFSINDMEHSHCYNPFHYIKKEQDVLTLIKSFMDGTDGKSTKTGGDPFWPKSERALLEALVFYMLTEYPTEKQNFTELSKLVLKGHLNPDDEYRSELDVLMADFEEYHPEHIAITQYHIFKLAPTKTQQSILISVGVRLDPFNIPVVSNLTRKDELKLETIGDKETALFITTPNGASPYDFIISMLYTQMFDSLYEHALEGGDTRLPHDVRFVMDEFANVGAGIPNFLERLTTMRKYGMYCMLFLQGLSQLKEIYKDNWETTMAACDTQMYLGGNEPSIMEDMAKKLGEMTIRVRDRSSSKSSNKGTDSKSYKYGSRKLLTMDEIRRMDDNHAIVLIRGQQPFYDEFYNPFDHPNARYLGNRDTKENWFEFDYCNTEIKDEAYLKEIIQEERIRTAKEIAEGKSSDGIKFGHAAKNADTYTVPTEPVGDEHGKATYNLISGKTLSVKTKNMMAKYSSQKPAVAAGSGGNRKMSHLLNENASDELQEGLGQTTIARAKQKGVSITV